MKKKIFELPKLYLNLQNNGVLICNAFFNKIYLQIGALLGIGNRVLAVGCTGCNMGVPHPIT